MDDTWNNVELTNISRRASYTLNHEYDANAKYTHNNNNINNNYKNEGIINNSNQKEIASSSTLQPGSDIKPKVTNEIVETLLRRLYGITIGEIKEFISYDDRNFYVQEDP